MTGGFSSGQSGLSGWDIDTPITIARSDLASEGLAIFVFSGSAATSASTSSAGLSLRNPLNAACRMLPAPVQPANSISATRSGFAQCMLASFGGLAPAANGLVLLATARSFGISERITLSPKPVPTRPT